MEENIIEKIIKNDQVRPRGWKLIELPLLERPLKNKKGTSLIVGERGGEDGILATVLENEGISKPVHCIDIQPIGDDPEKTFGAEKIKEGKIKFFQDDLITWEPEEIYDYVVCINVLEHFGFDQSGNYTKPNYDFKGFEKMLSMCRKNLLLSIPYDPFLIGEKIKINEQHYGDDRISTLETIARKAGFWTEEKIRLINVDSAFRTLDQINISDLAYLPRREQHEYLIFLNFTKIPPQ